MMKKTLFIAITAFIFIACSVGNISKSGGMDNQGYLQFIQSGSAAYKDGVTVVIDDNPAFTAKVDEDKKFQVKGNTYVVKPGTRHIKVSYQGKILYEKNVIIAMQETKQINLP
jgi:hypothetical protein